MTPSVQVNSRRALNVHRDACALPGVRWIEPVVVPLLGSAVHPNVFGMAGMATATAAAIGGYGP
ncbi:hypothetical protein BH23ACT12_BH23ACT12_08210 [soil metagenome]